MSAESGIEDDLFPNESTSLLKHGFRGSGEGSNTRDHVSHATAQNGRKATTTSAVTVKQNR